MSGMIRRLRWKIVGISMLFVTLVLAAVFTGVMLTARSSLEQSSTRQLEKALRGEGYDGQNGQPCFVTEVYSSGTVRVMGSSYYQISEEDLLALVQECLSQQEESGLLTDYHLRYLRYDGALSIRIAFTDSTLEQSALRAMAGNLLLIALAALVVLLGCSYLLSGVAARPVERAWQEQQRFLSDASHELKTPLAAIRLLTDSILQTENIDRETAREFVTDIGQEAERLSRITEDLLRLTRLDSNVLERPVVVDALPVLEQVMRMMSLVAQEKGTELTYRAEGTCTMLATRDEIHQIIYNLTDNAVKYTPPGSTVQVSLFREGDQVVLTVEDNGAGIPEEDLPRIFERFYRVDKARSRAAGGTGLGLAIVRDTVEKRGGTVEAANRPGGGAVFTVRWPWREGGGQT